MVTARFAEPMARLIDELRKLPGIGTKTAQRLAFHMLRTSEADARALSAAILELRSRLKLCSVCNNVTDVDPCLFCASGTREHDLICVVEEPTNISTIEKTRGYGGVYHVLHGTLSPVNGVAPEHLRLANLFSRVPGAREIILATSPTTEGEATAGYLAGEIRRLAPSVRLTRIATGVPAGSDIEYADEVTMSRAMEGRREL